MHENGGQAHAKGIEHGRTRCYELAVAVGGAPAADSEPSGVAGASGIGSRATSAGTAAAAAAAGDLDAAAATDEAGCIAMVVGARGGLDALAAVVGEVEGDTDGTAKDAAVADKGLFLLSDGDNPATAAASAAFLAFLNASMVLNSFSISDLSCVCVIVGR